MRVLYIHQYFTTPAMSGGTRSYEFGRRLVERGHHVTMITSATDGTARRSETIAGMEVVWLPVRYSQNMSYGRRLSAFGGFAAAAARESLRHDYDIVFATSTPLTVVLPGSMAAHFRRVPMALEVRDLWPEVPIAIGALRSPAAIRLAKSLERFAYSQARHIVALSPGMAEGITRQGVPETKVTIIPNGCDVDTFGVTRIGEPPAALREARRGGRPIALYAGAIGRVNDLEYLVRVADQLGRMGSAVSVVVVGDGSEKEAVISLARRLGALDRSFFLLPPQSKDQMPRLLAWSDIALSIFAPIPEMEANSSNKFFDALAAGRPVAVNYGGWHQELLENHACGIRLAPDVGVAAESLDTFLRDRDRLRAAGYAARRLAERAFSRDRLLTDLEAVFVGAVD